MRYWLAFGIGLSVAPPYFTGAGSLEMCDMGYWMLLAT